MTHGREKEVESQGGKKSKVFMSKKKGGARLALMIFTLALSFSLSALGLCNLLIIGSDVDADGPCVTTLLSTLKHGSFYMSVIPAYV